MKKIKNPKDPETKKTDLGLGNRRKIRVLMKNLRRQGREEILPRMTKNLGHGKRERIQRAKMNLNQSLKNLNEILVQKMMTSRIKMRKRKGNSMTVRTMRKSRKSVRSERRLAPVNQR